MKADRLDPNRRSAVNAAATLTGICLVPAMLLPYITGAAARDLSFNSQQLGLVATALLGGVILVMASSVLWIRKLNWSLLVAAGSIVALAAFLATGFARSFEPMLTCMAFAGFGTGIVYAPAICALGDTHDPDRNFGRAFFLQIVLGGAAGFVATELLDQRGLRAIMVLLSVIFALGLCLIPFLPAAGAKQAVRRVTTPGLRSVQIHAGLAGMLLLTVGPTAIWVFFERIGVEAGFSTRSVGNVIATGLLLGAPGALLSGAAAKRFGRIGPLTLATSVMVCTFAIAITTHNLAVYGLCGLLFQFLWNFSLAFQFGAVSQADASGRLIVLAPVAQGLGAMIAPALAGTLMHDSGYWPAVGLAAITSCAGLALLVWLCRPLASGPWMGQAETISQNTPGTP
jgi:MFS transporter, DHA1 family, inner membrane transport protein